MGTNNYKYFISAIIASLRILFGLIFIFSATIKLIDIDLFRDAINNFNLINESLLEISVFLVPILELLLGLALVLNFKTSIASQLITFMVAFFTAIVVAKIFEGADISCGCFGEFTSDKIDGFTVIRNIILIIWGILLTVYYGNNSIKTKIEKDTKIISKYNTSRFLKTLQSTLLVTIFFFLAVQTVIFAIQNRELKTRLSLLLTDKDVLNEGDSVKIFTAMDLEENVHKIDYKTEEKTLIFILSTKCSPCTKNLPNWTKITEKLENKNIRIFGVALNSLEDVKTYDNENDLKLSYLCANRRQV